MGEIVVSLSMRDTVLQNFMAVATGYLVSFIFFDLFNEAGGQYSWIFVGVLVVFLFDRFISPHLSFLAENKDHTHCSHHHHNMIHKATACSTIGCLILCTLFDGVAISSTYNVSHSLGNKLLLGQIFHLIPEAILVFSVSLASGMKKKHLWIPLSSVIAALILGFLAPEVLSHYQSHFLPMSVGILIYITFSQLLPISAAGKKGALYAIVGMAFFAALKLVLQL